MDDSRNDLEHALCARCGIAYADVLQSGVVALVCESRSCGAQIPIPRRAAPPIAELEADPVRPRRQRTIRESSLTMFERPIRVSI